MSDFAKGGFLALAGLLILCSATVRGILLPFAFALLLAKWADRPVSRLAGHLPRWLSALVILSIAGLMVCNLTLLAGVRLWQSLPGVLSQWGQGTDVTEQISATVRRLPGPLGIGAGWIVTQLQNQSGALHQRLEGEVSRRMAAMAAGLPRVLIGGGVTLLAGFYACVDWQRVKTKLKGLLPSGWERGILALGRRLADGAAGWLQVQGRMIVIQFALLWVGLGWIGISQAWGIALIAAFADALPVLGTGIILAPWSVLSFVQGDWRTGAGLLALWGVVSLCRSVLEPRLLGAKAGQSPLLTLLVLYGGLRLAGIPGLILGPVALSAFSSAACQKSTEKAAARTLPDCGGDRCDRGNRTQKLS